MQWSGIIVSVQLYIQNLSVVSLIFEPLQNLEQTFKFVPNSKNAVFAGSFIFLNCRHALPKSNQNVFASVFDNLV